MSETWARTPIQLFALPGTTLRFFSPPNPSSELWASAQLPTQPLLMGTQASASGLLRSTGRHPRHLFLSPTPSQTHQSQGPSQATFRIPSPLTNSCFSLGAGPLLAHPGLPLHCPKTPRSFLPAQGKSQSPTGFFLIVWTPPAGCIAPGSPPPASSLLLQHLG